MSSNYLVYLVFRKIIYLIVSFSTISTENPCESILQKENLYLFAQKKVNSFSTFKESLYKYTHHSSFSNIKNWKMTNFNFLQDSSINDIEKKYNPILVKHFNDSFHRIEYNIKRNTVYFNILIYFLIYYFYWDLSIKMRRFKVFDLSSSLNKLFSEQKVQPTIRIIQNDSINDLTEKYILNGLKNFEEKTIFLQKNITLGKLATELDTNVKYLSIVIKKHKAENFNSYVNKLRINYITQKLENENNFVKYKISHLSDLCGYSSPAAFTKSFTEIIKTTPSEFIRNIKKKRNEVELETV